MKSHDYKTTTRDWFIATLPTLLMIVAFAGFLQAADYFGLLPSPPKIASPGSTVLAHHAIAARAGLPGEIVLLGDSTCMMDVDAPMLEASLPGRRPVLNLGLIVWLGFEDFAELLAEHSDANPGQIKTVILLVTPTQLISNVRDSMTNSWQQIRQEVTGQRKQYPPQTSADWLCRDIFRKNLLGHWLVRPLHGVGDGPMFYGFHTEIDKYMTEHQGSVLVFGTHTPARKKEEWRLEPFPELETKSRLFREKLPPGVKLIVGLTPMPESRSTPEERRQRPELLAKWSFYLNADVALTNLPAKLPNVFFADGGHLNSVGQKKFTAILSRELTPFLKADD